MHRTKKDKKFKFVYAEIRLGSSETQMPGLMRPCPRPLLGEASPSNVLLALGSGEHFLPDAFWQRLLRILFFSLVWARPLPKEGCAKCFCVCLWSVT